MSNLPKTGLQAVVEGATKFVKDLDGVNKAIETNSKQTKEASKNASPLSKELGKLGVSFDSIKQKISSFVGVNSQAVDGLSNILLALGPIGGVALAAAAGIAVLTAGVIALGARGAPLVDLGNSFDRLAAGVGLSSKALLVDLRKAAAGTVADFDLIKRANLALVGATGQFGQEFGKNLPKLLEVSRTAAKATGQDVDFLFNSIVTGIKRASPRLIDNTGIVLKLGEANQMLADKLGKSVAQLTDEEKQIAVLNATIESGQALIESVGLSQETNAEKLARVGATITNIFDGISIAVQPAFSAILDVVNNVLGSLQDLVRRAAPFINFIAQGIAKVIQFIGGAISSLFGENGIGRKLGEGAFNAFASFSKGIAAAANKLIFPVVIQITKFIADFLVGLSPPPKGPLSQIDKGGYNVMSAWLDGFAGVSLDPVEQVTAEVNAAMGAIGQASLPAVEARLAQLDSALKPFQNRLDIVKSQFEAIEAPAKAALEAIDRQVQEAEAALAGGDQAAAERLRQLDAAREAIQGQLDAQQGIVDRQQIQLALATASQAQERALLNIRRAALAAAQKKAQVDQAAGSVPNQGQATGGAGAPPAEETLPGGLSLGVPGESVLDDFQMGTGEALGFTNEMIDQLIGKNTFLELTDQATELATQVQRIQGVDVGAKLTDKFKGITDIFDPSNPDSISAKLTGFVSTLTGDGEGSIVDFFAHLPDKFEAIKDDLLTRIEAVGDSIFNPETKDSAAYNILAFVQSLTGDSNIVTSIAHFFSELPANITAAAEGLFDQIKTTIFDPIADYLTGEDEGTFGGVIAQFIQWFTNLGADVTTALQGFGASVYTAIAVPIITVINGLITSLEAGLKGALIQIAGFLGSAADTLSGILDTTAIRNIANDLTTKAQSISFGRLSVEMPSFLQATTPPGAAGGGMFGPGRLRVGERGPETLFNASKVGVLPAELTRVLEGLGSMMAQPAPMAVPGNTYNESSSSYNFYGVQSDNDARRRFNALRAGMR